MSATVHGYTVTFAKYGSPDNSVIIATTSEAGLVAMSRPDWPDAYNALVASGLPIAAFVPPAPTANDVALERERRLSLGFNYTFPPLANSSPDPRGTHRIGTTLADMTGWTEVTTASQAAIALGLANTQINIVTDTGPCVVTALEWQSILLSASAFRQPVWAASFALEYTNPIPTDYTANTHWPAIV